MGSMKHGAFPKYHAPYYTITILFLLVLDFPLFFLNFALKFFQFSFSSSIICMNVVKSKFASLSNNNYHLLTLINMEGLSCGWNLLANCLTYLKIFKAFYW